MSDTYKYAVVLTTTGDEQAADELAKKIILAKLAACVQIQKIKSHYEWKGSLNCDAECLLLIKTRYELFDELESFIRKNHTYETPEIIQVPVTKGFKGYLSWIDEVTHA